MAGDQESSDRWCCGVVELGGCDLGGGCAGTTRD